MQWTKCNTITGPDAYVDWVLEPARHLYPEYQDHRVFLRAHAPGTLQDLFAGGFQPDPGSPASAAATHASARASTALLTADRPGENRQATYDAVLIPRLPDDAYCPIPASRDLRPELPDAPDAGRVIVAVIDEGIAFAHDRFRTATSGSRVEFAWLQDAACLHPTGRVAYGRELCKRGFVDASGNRAIDGIDDLIDRHSTSGRLDETAFYAEVGLIDHRRPGHKAAAQRVAHGTHVMDLAAGYDRKENRTDRPIICVQLPSVVVMDTSGIGLQGYLHDALRYIVDRAAELAGDGPPLPLVINFSSGIRCGPGDGTSPLETAIDEIIEERRQGGGRTEIVLPAGNSFEERGRAAITLGPKGSATARQQLAWRVQPDDRTASFLEIWLPATAAGSDACDLDLSIVPPGRSRSGPRLSSRTDRRTIQWETDTGDPVCVAYFEERPCPSVESAGKPVPYSRGRFLVALLPTAWHNAGAPLAPPGLWTVRLRNRGRSQQQLSARIHWDNAPLGYPQAGRQSYFDPLPAAAKQPGPLVDGSGTLNAIATGAVPTVVGGYYRQSRQPARYSSSGPAGIPPGATAPTRVGPDLLAVSDESIARNGILAAGTRSGSRVAMNGTSVAAPQVTRLIADALAAGEADGRRHVKDLAAAGDSVHADHDRQPGSPGRPPPRRMGAGRLLSSNM